MESLDFSSRWIQSFQTCERNFFVAVPDNPPLRSRGKVKRDLPFLAIFSEKAGVGYLDYKLMVTMKCEALRVNKTLVTSFACVSVVGSQPAVADAPEGR